MRPLWQKISLGVGLVLVVGLCLFVGLYPYLPNSNLGWCVLIVLSLPVTLVLEFCGDKLLNPKFVVSLGRTGRVAYSVLVMGLLLTGVIVAFQYLEPLFEK